MNHKIDAAVVTAIRSLYEDDVAKAFFDWASQRTNDAAETSIERVAAVVGVGRSQAVGLGRQLAEAGCCDFVVGRKGWKTRLLWKFSLKSLGEVAKGQASKLENVDPEIVADTQDQQPSIPAADVAVAVETKMTIEEAKRALAATFGVSPTAIEILIRA